MRRSPAEIERPKTQAVLTDGPGERPPARPDGVTLVWFVGIGVFLGTAYIGVAGFPPGLVLTD